MNKKKTKATKKNDCCTEVSAAQKRKMVERLSKIVLDIALEDLKQGNVAPDPFMQLRGAMLDAETFMRLERNDV